MSKASARALFLTLIILFPLSIFWWHVIDNRPSSMDETRHMKLATDYVDWLMKGVPLTDGWSHVYPPMFHLSLLVPLSHGIPSESKAVIANVGYFLIFVLACVLFGRATGIPDWQSVLAAFLCSGYCFVFWASRRALIDYALMCWVTFSMAMLLRTEGFSNPRAGILWGIVAGLGLLLKPPFLFFSVGPVLWVLATSPHANKWKTFFTSAIICTVIAAPWYFWQSAYFLQKASSLAVEPQGPGTDPHTLAGWLFYIHWLRIQMGVPSLIFTMAGILLAFRKRSREGNGFLVAWVLSGYIPLSLLINKDPRHTLSLLPALAILAAKGWGYFAADWGGGLLIALAGPVLLIFNMSVYDRPAQEDWHIDDILKLMVARHDPTQPLLEASLLSHHPRFFSRTMKWSAMQEGIDLSLTSPGDSNTSFVEFIITRPGDQGSETSFIDSLWQDLHPQTRAFKSLFSVVGQFSLPDKSTAFVYERDPHPNFHVTPLSRQELERKIAEALQVWIQGSVKVSVEATPSGLKEGRLRRVRVTCSACSFQGVRIEKAEVVVEKPWLNLYRLWDENRLGLMAFESLKPTLEVKATDAKARLASVKELAVPDVQMTGGKLTVTARFKGIPVAATAQVIVDHSRYAHLDAILNSLSIDGLPLPGWILGKAHRQTLWIYPIPDFPGKILVNHVALENGELQVS